jgi:O-antigen/teichoic acid export membrane protein
MSTAVSPPVGDAPGPSLSERASSGVLWLTVQTWVSRLGAFVTVAVLARLLTPADFGVVAIALTILPVVYLLADLGFTTYLVQSERIDRTSTSTAFWSSTAIGVLLAGLIVLAAPLLATLFGVPAAAPAIAGVAPAVLIVALAATPIALLRREMRFRALSVQSGAAALLGQAIALVLALTGAGVWALIAQVLVQQGVVMALAWAFAHWRPHLVVSRTDFREMIGFGVKVMSVDFAAMTRFGAENVLISRVVGAAGLGALGVAQRFVQTAKDLTGSAIAPVSLVAFARIRGDRDRVFSGYRRSVRITFAATAPALAGVLVLAPVAVPLIFGDQWTASVGAVQGLAAAALVGLAATLDHGLFYGLGRPGRWLAYAVVAEVLTLAATLAFVAQGIAAVAWAAAGVTALCTVARWFLVARLLSVPTRRVAGVTVTPLVVVAVSLAVGQGVFALTAGVPSIVRMLAVAVMLVLAHLGAVRLLLPATSAELWGLVAARLPGRMRPGSSAPRRRGSFVPPETRKGRR